jgi:ABC-2 type transport system permease protein
MWRISVIALHTMVVKETRRFMRVWIQTLLPPAVTTLLYFLIFGHVLGDKVGAVQGMPYAAYIAPGLIMMTVINNAYANGVSSFFQAKFFRSIEELLVAPIRPSLLLIGFMVGGIVRGAVVALVVGAVAFCFVRVPVQHVLLTIIVVLLTATVFSLAGIINAIYAKKFDDTSLVPTFILTPLTYLGGVFFSVSALPGIWPEVARFNPIFYFVDLFRYAMLGVCDTNLVYAMWILVGLLVLLYLFAWGLLIRGQGIKT